MDRIINVHVNGHYLTKDGNKAGVKGEANATKLMIWFNENDKEWGGCAKEVIFHNALGENPTKVIITPSTSDDGVVVGGGVIIGGGVSINGMIGDEIGYKIPIPPEAMTEHGWMSFTIQGVDDGVVLKSLTDKLFVHDSPDTSKAGNTVRPTPSDLEQLRKALEDILNDIYTAQEAARRAEEILEAIQNEDYWAMMSKSYAVGGTGRREGEDTDNSKYYYLLARIIATQPFLLEDDVTGDLYRLGVSDGLLYIEKIDGTGGTGGTGGSGGSGGSDGTPPIEGGDSIVPGSGSISEYIVSASINDSGELVFVTNTGRTLNAGKLPTKDDFVVEFHEEDGVVLPSKTIDQIKQAVADGQTVICEYATEGRRFRGTLLYHSEEAFVFSVKDWEGKEVFFQINADGSLNYDERIVPELFVVRFTETDGTYTADKTFAEVKAALDGGNVVVADWTNLKLRGQLTGYSDDLLEFTFHSFLGADAYLILQSDNTVTHLVSEVGKEKIPSQVSVAKNGNVITVTATVSGSLGGFGDEVTTITLNDDGDPVSVTKDGKTTTLTWSGFDE